MDNPNDFIHIDEVFKRMKDREEPEAAGSWMRMKDLLDSEMPVAPVAVAGSSLRRYMIPLVALLLIGSGVAYYKLKDNNLSTDKPVGAIASNNNKSVNNSTGITKDLANNIATENQHASVGSASHAGNKTSDKQSGDHFAASGKRNPNSTNHSGSHNTNPKNNHSNSGNSENIVASANDNHKSPNTSNGDSEKQTKVSKPLSGSHNGKGAKSNTGKGHQKSGNNSIADNTKAKNMPVAGVQNVDNGTTAASNKPKAFEEQNVLENIYPSSGSNSEKNHPSVVTGLKSVQPSSSPQPVTPGMKVVAANWNDNKIVKDDLSGGYFKEVRDTFKRIEMVERMAMNSNSGDNKTLTKVIDTLTITRVERIKFTPLDPIEMAALRKAKIIPKSAANFVPLAKVKEYTVANEMVNLVPLANYKVASRKMDPSKFNQLIQNTTQGISNYFDGTNKFYAAILLGGNAFVGNPGAFGMQFGIAGLYQLSERLTLGAEIKFANHYFSNYTINDQSIGYADVSSQQVPGVGWLFNGTQTTTTSAYRVNSFSALEFPITLSYSLGRVSVFGGLNLSYAFPVQWEKTNTLSVQKVNSTESSDKSPFVGSTPTMNEQKDFSSRMGVGYVGGVSYDVSRRISLDARMTQNLWTNYNGNAKAVNDLFKTPTFQFSIGYFFGRKERVVYIMDKR